MPVRSACTSAQPADFVTVAETIILRDRPGRGGTPGSLPSGRSLLLKLHNGTDVPVGAVTLRIEQLDRRGGSLGVSDYELNGFSAGAGEDFVPDRLILLDNACTEVRAEVLTADSQGFRLMRADGRTVVTCPEPEPDTVLPETAHTVIYSRTAGLRTGAAPAVLSLLALAVLTVTAVCGHEAAAFLSERVTEPVLHFLRSLI